MGVGGQRHAPADLTPGKDPVPILQEVGWASGPVGVIAENLALPVFDPRTFQPVASRYTDWATLGPESNVISWICKIHFWRCNHFSLFYFEAPVLLRKSHVMYHWFGVLRANSFISCSSVCLSFPYSVLLLSKVAGWMQGSARAISVAIQYYVLWNGKEGSGNNQQFSRLRYNCRRYLW
jgi:hypothetical protein